jgi:uracil-DNA glycosylase
VGKARATMYVFRKSSFMSHPIPHSILEGISLAHPAWHECLHSGLQAVMRADPEYLHILGREEFLPTDLRLFAAFSQPINVVSHVLVGEGPYPRAESATGFCFMDGAVKELWSENGLSKRVNRATSLRNFMKMLLVADGRLSISRTTGDAMAEIALEAQAEGSAMIQTLAELQDNLHRQGFLLLNATPVYREHVPPVKESRAWEPFLLTVLQTLVSHANLSGKPLPQLVLWGKIAERLSKMPQSASFPQALSEHPYNLSFIANPVMQELFGSMRLLNIRM